VPKRAGRSRAIHVVATLAGAGALATSLAVGLAPAHGQAPTPPAGSDRDPAFVYRRDCAVCHGADGHGTNRGPSLERVGAASVHYWVSTGRMPLVDVAARDPESRDLRPLPGVQLFDPEAKTKRRAPAYDRATTDALVAYVTDLAAHGGPPVPGADVTDSANASVATGGSVFRLQCAACHAWAGDGGALLHREAPALHQATATQIAEAVRVGPGAMPAFGTAALNDRDLADLVAYVRYLDHPKDRGGWNIWHLGPVAEGGVAWVIAMSTLVVAVRWMGEST
jgi:ubiquinol-cytochrome c reductase cytochrome c subunit